MVGSGAFTFTTPERIVFQWCRNACDKYIKELVAAVPGVVVIKP